MFNPLQNEALDEWFQRFNAPLKCLPAQERAELHQEVRQHLESLVTANEELGSSPDEAWQLALTQFGDPSRIGRRLVREWRRSTGRVSMDMMTLLSGLVAQTAVLLGIFAVDYLCNTSGMTTLVSLLGMPLLAGIALGRTCPWRALAGSLYGTLVWPVLPTIAAFSMFTADPPAYAVGKIAFFIAWWLGLTCTGAYVASAPKRGWYKPSLADLKLALPLAWKKNPIS